VEPTAVHGARINFEGGAGLGGSRFTDMSPRCHPFVTKRDEILSDKRNDENGGHRDLLSEKETTMQCSLMNQRSGGQWDRTVILPPDLGRAIGRPVLVKLCLDAVQAADPVLLAEARRVQGLRPEMLVTLLTYCYATGLYDSRDVIAAIRTDPTIRYISAGARPDWQTLRRFRRNNRNLLRAALVYVFTQTWAFHFEIGEADYVDYDWYESNLVRQLTLTAADRLDVAALMDGSDCD
jgi:hypothetical protein